MLVAEKENEIVAIPKLVRRLFLEGAVLTFDAMGCQRDVAAACRDAGAHYLLYLTSLDADAKRLRRIARAHWESRTGCTRSLTSCLARTTAAPGAASPRRT